MNFSIRMEGVAMILVAIIAMFHLSGRNTGGFRHKLFSGCLALMEVTTALDIVTIITIRDAAQFPIVWNHVLNMLYFFGMNTLLSLVAVYSFYVLFDHMPDRHCFYIATKLISVFYVIMQILVVLNPWTGWLFAFREGQYVRGILNKSSYLMLLIELGMLCMCYIRNRKSVSHAMRRLMHMMPPVVFFLAVMQIMLPDTLLNGTIAAVVMLIFYLSFQSNKLYEDSLTELPNRVTFLEELDKKRKKGTRLHLLMIHLRDFDLVNQKFGMQTGDDVLYMVARYLDQVSDEYTAFRYRNTRFILVGPYKGEEAKVRIAKAVQKKFDAPWLIQDTEFILHTGIACVVADPEDETHQLIDEMEFAVRYSAEHEDGSLICFDRRLQQQFERRAYVMEQLRRALKNDTLQVYFQPIYDCRSGKFLSAETLVRLWDEEGRPISPGEFIPLAEEKGLIDEVGWAVLRKACEFQEAHPGLSMDSVSINVSLQQMEDIMMVSRMYDFLKEHSAKGMRISIEITERVMAENPQRVASLMKKLGAAGISFYLDDFGIGYSNFASLLKLPFEVVKIDGSLVSGIEADQKLYQMVHHLINMLHDAGFRVVVEGVETEEQVRIAKELCVDHIQGYYYAKPMPENELVTFIERENGR